MHSMSTFVFNHQFWVCDRRLLWAEILILVVILKNPLLLCLSF